jgi:murein DD-endopeptidase MepM/ murein hydrolase activator NlpD
VLVGAAVTTCAIGLSLGLASPARADEGVSEVYNQRQGLQEPDPRTAELPEQAGSLGDQGSLSERQSLQAESEPKSKEKEKEKESKKKSKKKKSKPQVLTCPVAGPRSYTDTYGAPRSGGRKHMGTDIFAPRGAAILAIEDGTIDRLGENPLGGTSLYLEGESDTSYYYAHLDGYVDGLEEGSDVEAGEHLAYNGNTGNARSTRPHLHLEVMPDGGDNVNPYPYVERACG